MCICLFVWISVTFICIRICIQYIFIFTLTYLQGLCSEHISCNYIGVLYIMHLYNCVTIFCNILLQNEEVAKGAALYPIPFSNCVQCFMFF